MNRKKIKYPWPNMSELHMQGFCFIFVSIPMLSAPAYHTTSKALINIPGK